MRIAFARHDYRAAAKAGALTTLVVFALIFLSFFMAFAEGDGASAPKKFSLAGRIVGVLLFPALALPRALTQNVEGVSSAGRFFLIVATAAVVWGAGAAVLAFLWSKRGAATTAREPTTLV